jgi:hypothetical protein
LEVEVVVLRVMLNKIVVVVDVIIGGVEEAEEAEDLYIELVICYFMVQHIILLLAVVVGMQLAVGIHLLLVIQP